MTLPGTRGTERTQTGSSLAQTIDVETPELVVFSYTIAGVGSRALAALIDSLLCLGAIVALMFALVAVSGPRSDRPMQAAAFDAWAAAIVRSEEHTSELQ